MTLVRGKDIFILLILEVALLSFFGEKAFEKGGVENKVMVFHFCDEWICSIRIRFSVK